MMTSFTSFFVFFLFITLISMGVLIGGIIYLVKDAPKQEQNTALWVALFIFFGNMALAIYMFMTKRIGWGLFWLIVFPLILLVPIGIIFISVMSTTYVIAPFFM